MISFDSSMRSTPFTSNFTPSPQHTGRSRTMEKKLKSLPLQQTIETTFDDVEESVRVIKPCNIKFS